MKNKPDIIYEEISKKLAINTSDVQKHICPQPPTTPGLLGQAQAIKRFRRESLPYENDKTDMKERYKALMEVLKPEYRQQKRRRAAKAHGNPKSGRGCLGRIKGRLGKSRQMLGGSVNNTISKLKG